MRKTFIFIMFILSFASIFAADDTPEVSEQGFFHFVKWNRSLWADMHPDIIRMDIANASNHSEYDWEQSLKKRRTYTFMVLGVDIPFWNGQWNDKQYEVAVTMPVSMNIWLDMFQRVTSPVVNTDYRIGAPEVSFIQRFNLKFLKNYTIRFAAFKHESTHIGDELTIMRKEFEMPITRVNVSYNYAEIVATINDADGSSEQNHCFRLGLMLSYNKSWYTMKKGDGDASKIKPKYSPFEAYIQYQYQTPPAKCHIQGLFSAEVRNRQHYGYPIYKIENNGVLVETANNESRTWTINAFAGISYHNSHNKSYFSKIGVGLRMYYGICPYGQFRSIKDYSQYGISVIFE